LGFCFHSSIIDFQSYGKRRSTIFVNEEIGRETVLETTGGALNKGAEVQVTIKRTKGLKEVVADGVWGITKIIIDPQIANFRLVDSALFAEQGSFINYINRICQKPFVEFYTETIGDEFYWIARKPPHNKESILDAINGLTKISTDDKTVSTLAGGEPQGRKETVPTVQLLPSFVINIEPLDTIRVNLRFDDRAFSWFKFEPRYAFGGSQDSLISLALLPAVFLPTYTNLYGSRPLNVSSNYVNYIPSNGEDDEKNYKNAIEQAYYDLSWLIQTHAYLPFTRTGTITINEDRRIKKGMFVRLKSTAGKKYSANDSGEIFLVTQVNHSLSTGQKIERTTTLQVERGMIEEYIEGVEVEGYGKVGYFELVNTDINLKRLRTDLTSGESYQPISHWKENERCIDFFLQRRQFE